MIVKFAIAAGMAVFLAQAASVSGQNLFPSLLDTSFNAGAGANGDVFALARDGNGLFLVAGEFTSFNSVSRGRLARLQAGGSLDVGFFNGDGANAAIYAVALQAD